MGERATEAVRQCAAVGRIGAVPSATPARAGYPLTGDPPQDLGHRVFATGPVELTPRIKREAPELTVYAGFDRYRCSVREGLAYLHAKRDAGADGFLSQPFFDLRLLDAWRELLAGGRVFWGVAPVAGTRTRAWWETKSHAFFPAAFEPTLEWSREFAAHALDWARAAGTNLYFMPIRVDLATSLGGIP